MEFDWDQTKAAINARKHGVTFGEAVAVFADRKVIDFDVSRPEDGELRSKAVGLIEGRLFAVTYTIREGVHRLISARRANAKEAQLYGHR